MKRGSYHQATGDLKSRLLRAVESDRLRDLHQKEPLRHFLVAFRQLGLLFLAFSAGWRFDSWWIRLLAAIVLGFVVFDGTVLLHEVVHKAVFRKRWPRGDRLLALIYALPSGISPSQFTRWHLDHHAELGSSVDDPKRAHLSPKRNARWLKLLYATPALFPIYFLAARKETSTYPEALRRTIAVERSGAILLHLGTAAAIGQIGGIERLLWLYIIPVFVFFPPAFALNRLGQHYDIDPANPAKWSTRMTRSRFWGFVFLWSHHHLEHHYFPGVPFYRLPDLNRALEPFFSEEGIRARSYGGLLRDWLLRNRAPHTNWAEETRPFRPPPPSSL